MSEKTTLFLPPSFSSFSLPLVGLPPSSSLIGQQRGRFACSVREVPVSAEGLGGAAAVEVEAQALPVKCRASGARR